MFIVGDIITIGSDTVRYKVTAISFDSGSSGAGDLTIEQESHSTQGLAAAVSSRAQGQCPAASIGLNVGSKYDPNVKFPSQQIMAWLHIRDSLDNNEAIYA